MKNMTALVSCFARCYHTENSSVKIYNDPLAREILAPEEYSAIAENMAKGIAFFNPNYKGNNPLEWIVNNRLAPSVLARSAFCQRHLINEINLALKQYVILASGYDTSAYGINVKAFELDMPDMISDKINRIKKAEINCENVTYIGCDLSKDWVNPLLSAGYDSSEKSFFSLLGISYYLAKNDFESTIAAIAKNSPIGSCIVFDYPNTAQTAADNTNRQLAKAAGEEMKSTYSYEDIELMADRNGLLIYEHISDKDVNEHIFNKYNEANPESKIYAPAGVSYCLMVKK